MFNLKLYKNAEKKHGSLWAEGANEELIENLSKELDVEIPQSYKKFLQRFGEGGVTGVYFFGITDSSYSSAYKHTMKFRKEYKINSKWIVVADESNDWEEYILCLDTSRMKDCECPVIKYDYINSEKEDYKENFYDLFNYKCEVLLND